MRKLFSIFLFLSFFGFAQTSTSLIWAKSLSGIQSNAQLDVFDITTDSSGNVYTTGHYWHVVDFDPGPGTYTLDGGVSGEAFISKLDVSGNFIWIKRIEGPNGSRSRAISLDQHGNIYTTGFFNQTMDFDPGPGVFNLTTAIINVPDIFVSKLDNNGNFLWAKQFTGTDPKNGKSLGVDAQGNVYITGDYMGTVDFDPGPAIFNLTSNGYYDFYVSKLDALGNFVWAKSIGSQNIENGNSLELDSIGNVYVTGFYSDTVDFDPGPATLNLTGTYNTGYILRLDQSGTLIWAKSAGENSIVCPLSTTLDHSGNVLITGIFKGQPDMNPDPNIITNLFYSGSGYYDSFIAKYNAIGKLIWAKKVGGTLDEFSYDIAVDDQKNVYTVGLFSSPIVDFDPGIAVYNISPQASNYDFYCLKLDSSGNFIWIKNSGGSLGNDVSKSIVVDKLYNVYTTGTFAGTVDFDFDLGVYNLTGSSTSYDVFVHKMGQCITPSAPINSTPLSYQSICSGNSTTLSINASGVANWYTTSTSTTVINTGNSFVTPTLAVGNYTYYVDDSTCTNSNSKTAITLTVNACTGLKDFSRLNDDIKIYPNPTNDILNIEFERNNKVKVEIADALGQLIFEEIINSKNVTLNLKNLTSGLYFLKVINDNKIIATQKIVKE